MALFYFIIRDLQFFLKKLSLRHKFAPVFVPQERRHVLLFLMSCLTGGSCVCVLASCAAYFKPYTWAIDYKCHMNRIYNPE